MSKRKARKDASKRGELAAEGERSGGKRPQAVWGWAVAVVGVSAAMRGVCALNTAAVPWLRHLVGDAAGYWEWAGGIAGGDWIGGESFYQAPLYPYALAVLFTVFGDAVWVVRLVQSCAGVVGAGLICFTAWRLFGTRVGAVAGVMLGLYAPAVFFDGIIQKTSMGCVLTCGLLACLAWNGMGGRVLPVGVLGVVSGALVLTRENALVWVPILGVWAAVSSVGGNSGERRKGECQASGTGERRRPIGQRERRARALGVFILGVLLVLGPVGIRNWAVSGEWSVSTFQAGPNFYIGNHAGASGLYEPLIRGHETPAFERRDATALAQGALGRKLSAREVSAYWMGRTLADIHADPTGWAGLLARKTLLVWNRYEMADVESLHIYGEFSSVLKVLGLVWHFGVLCPLAAVGLWVTWNERRKLWIYYALIASMAASVAFFYVLARYRFPLVPLLIPFAAAGCVRVWDLLRCGRYRRLIGPALVAGVVAAVVNWPMVDERRLDALGWMNLGVAVAEEGKLESATGYFRLAVSGYADSAEANNNLAMALALQGVYAEAIPHYEAALASDPTLTGVSYNLGVALERVGRAEDALVQYERAMEFDPSDTEARQAVQRLGGRQ